MNPSMWAHRCAWALALSAVCMGAQAQGHYSISVLNQIVPEQPMCMDSFGRVFGNRSAVTLAGLLGVGGKTGSAQYQGVYWDGRTGDYSVVGSTSPITTLPMPAGAVVTACGNNGDGLGLRKDAASSSSVSVMRFGSVPSFGGHPQAVLDAITPGVRYFGCDLNDLAGTEKAVTALADEVGGFDILVNNAAYVVNKGHDTRPLLGIARHQGAAEGAKCTSDKHGLASQ